MRLGFELPWKFGVLKDAVEVLDRVPERRLGVGGTGTPLQLVSVRVRNQVLAARESAEDANNEEPADGILTLSELVKLAQLGNGLSPVGRLGATLQDAQNFSGLPHEGFAAAKDVGDALARLGRPCEGFGTGPCGAG